MPLAAQFESVLAAAKTGDALALALLYREFQPGLLRYLGAQAPADSEDLASEVWLDAAAGLRRFEGDESGFRRWLFTIAHRRLVDLHRRDARRRSLLGSLESPELGTPDCEAEVLASSDTEAALALIGELPRDQAAVVLLRVVGGFNASDAATIIGKTPGAIRVLQHRALKRLATRLAQMGRTSVTQ
jgi:RNA polymerase sigma-70 factor (ECF subfamily)